VAKTGVPLLLRIGGLGVLRLQGLGGQQIKLIGDSKHMKQGLEYFSLDTTLDNKFELIEAEFGLVGFGIVVKLYQMIYGQQGYYVEWSDEVALMFAKKNNVGVSVVSEVVKTTLKRGIFDEAKFKQYGILTSLGVQKRFLEAVKRRLNAEIKREYDMSILCNNSDDVYKNSKNVYRNDKNVYILGKNVTESKVKESKVKESKESVQASPRSQNFIKPTFDEILAYSKERKREDLAKAFFDYYESGGWMDSKGQKVKNWKQKFITWETHNAIPLTAQRQQKESQRKAHAIISHDYSKEDLEKFDFEDIGTFKL
jgi:hypothetical protein